MGDVYLAQHCQFTYGGKYRSKLDPAGERNLVQAKLPLEREIAGTSAVWPHPNLVFASDAGIESKSDVW